MAHPTNDTPDFIEIETDNFVSPDAANDVPSDDFLALEIDAAPVALVPAALVPTTTETPVAVATEAPGELSTLAGDLASISEESAHNANGAVSGSLRSGTMAYVGFTNAQGYVTALANGVKLATAESYKQTLRTRYGFTPEMVAALVVDIIPESTPGLIDAPELSPEQQAANAAANGAAARAMSAQHRANMQARPLPVPVAAPVIDRGILPREQILKQLADESPGTLITMARSQRRATHVPRSTIVNALAGTEFADMAPRVKSDKRQFGEVMRGLNSQEFRTWAITRRDVAKTGQEWPESLEARWCMGALDGSDQLGTLGEKVLIADLLDNGEIRFTGGSDVLRAKVCDAFALRCGDEIMTATDLLGWFRDRVLPEHFHAFDCAGAIYVPGNPARIEAFIALISKHMSRRITLWDMVSGKKLSDSLMQGLIQMLDEIDADYASDCDKAREREANKVRKQNPDHTEADVTLAMQRAVVLSERAGTYLARINDAQSYLDGLKKLLGDDTAAIKTRLGALRTMITALCDDTAQMAANIELDSVPSASVPEPDAPQGPSAIEMD